MYAVEPVKKNMSVYLTVDETILSDEELRLERRRVKLNFALGCLLGCLTLVTQSFIPYFLIKDFSAMNS